MRYYMLLWKESRGLMKRRYDYGLQFYLALYCVRLGSLFFGFSPNDNDFIGKDSRNTKTRFRRSWKCPGEIPMKLFDPKRIQT